MSTLHEVLFELVTHPEARAAVVQAPALLQSRYGLDSAEAQAVYELLGTDASRSRLLSVDALRQIAASIYMNAEWVPPGIPPGTTAHMFA